MIESLIAFGLGALFGRSLLMWMEYKKTIKKIALIERELNQRQERV